MPDPRPRIDADSAPVVLGVRCRECAHPLPTARPLCPLCAGALDDARFGPGGTVFASTVIRIAVGDRVPPYALAYVDLDDGPRILATLASAEGRVDAPPVGARVILRGTTPAGDPLVEVSA